MIKAVVILSVTLSLSSAFSLPRPSIIKTKLLSSENTGMFGGDTPRASQGTQGLTTDDYAVSVADGTKRLESEAAKLRREAAEMELELRDEARKKGLPEEVIDKLVPLRGTASSVRKKAGMEAGAVAEKVEMKRVSRGEIRKKLGYLNSGDAVRFTSELDRIKGKGALKLWNSRSFDPNTNFGTNNYQLKTKAGIEPVDLRLDDVGFEYQKVFFVALAGASILAVSSNFVGGQLGFILGYLSALFPIGLVGIGSIAPGLIGDIINLIKYQIDEEARDTKVKNSAGKFLAGYVVGLPVSNFKTGGVSNSVEFFQLRPTGNEGESFERKKISQLDITRASVMCVAGSTAECIANKEASGTSPGDVNTLYELINAVEPSLSPAAVQDHIRFSVVNAHSILTEYKEEYRRLCEAFKTGESLEDCISIIEGGN